MKIRLVWIATILSFVLTKAQADAPTTNQALRMVIVGDSTVCNYPENSAQRGWGMFIQDYFNSNQLQVINLAAAGRSAKTFIKENRWAAALQEKPDYILIQFGHNDSHAPDRPESTDANSDYRQYLNQYIDEARARGSSPVLITPMCRRNFGEEGRIKNELRPYVEAMKSVAKEKNAPLVDLNTASVELCNRLGPSGSASLANSASDKTHFSAKGAKEMARLVMEKLAEAEPSLQRYETALPIKPDLIVAGDGSGDFRSVHAAVQSIPKPNRERKIILIRDGIYNEKVRIDASFVTLRGESRAGAHIQFPWARDQGRDAIGDGVVNINGDDCVLENLTIQNTDNVLGRHAFAVYGRGDRTVIQDADILSQGNDTLSLWRAGNRQNLDGADNRASPNGRYYHARLKVCGSVDFVCPRGLCYMRDSELTEVNPKSEAAMWHDGSRDKDMKFVLDGCRFDGPENFRLARHHHDAMFFFIDCSFAKSMRDVAPYRVIYPTSSGPATEENKKKNQELDQTNLWGERAYYFNSRHDGGDFAWHKDNLSAAPGSPARDQITAKWTFAGTWNPERTDAPRVVMAGPKVAGIFVVTFSEAVAVKGKPRLAFDNGEFAEFIGGSGGSKLEFSAAKALASPAKPKLDFNGGAIIACEAGTAVRVADTNLP